MKRLTTVLFLLVLSVTVRFSSVQAQQFTFPTFKSVWGLSFAGDAIPIGSRIDLTPSFPGGYSGAVWYSQRVFVSGGFITTAQFTVSERSGQTDYLGLRGGDGFAFVIQGFGGSPIGNNGGGLGYDGIPNSVAIEFDTYANEEWYNEIDSSSLSISIHTNGGGVNHTDEWYSIARNDAPAIRFDDGRVHTMRVTYDGVTLAVFLDECQTPEVTAVINFEQVLVIPGGQAWLGFTAGTAGSYERHSLYTWCFTTWPKFNLNYCACPPVPPADSIIVVGPPDTVQIHDVRYDTVTVVQTDTVIRPDTLTVTVRDTIQRLDTVTITQVFRDTVTILVPDTVVITRIETIKVTDTVEMIVYKDTLVVYDTIYVACYDPYQPYDTLCGGDYRIMERLNNWLRIISVTPNPASTIVSITYDTDENAAYVLNLYAADGKLVYRIADEPPGPGVRVTVTFDLSTIPSGRYILVLRSGGKIRHEWLYIES
jgi:enamine deaminase RidA (YjgF/YER057c/UK114 family)